MTRIFLILASLIFIIQLQAQTQYRQLTWEQKLSEQYRYQFPPKTAQNRTTHTAKPPPAPLTAQNAKPQTKKPQTAQRTPHARNMQKCLAQADKIAQQQAKTGRWERPDYIQLNQQQRRLEAQIDLYQRDYPTETATIQKYQTALLKVKSQQSKKTPYWTK